MNSTLEKIQAELGPTHTQLIAVSKTKPVEDILTMYHLGQLDFGENRVQELESKYEKLPKDIRWHFIGHLQTNKVKYIASFVHLIHSIDREKVLKAVNKEAAKNNRVIDVLLQFHIAEEDTKFGLNREEAQQLLEGENFKLMQNVRICGVMGMASFVDDEVQVRGEFRRLKSIFDHLKANYFTDSDAFKEISMGMSGDYRIAVEEGSTMVRIGSLLFGARS
jgi:pyridoxal phosphate enzyme (YggS family)